MNKKLIIINAVPTSTIFGNKIDAWAFYNHGLDTEFWDISLLFWRQKDLDRYYQSGHEFKFIGPNHTVINEKEVFVKKLSANNNAVYWYLSRFIKIQNDDWVIDELNRVNAQYIFQNFAVSDYPKTIGNILFKKPLHDLKQKFLNRKCNPYAVITSGEEGDKQVKNIYNNKTQIISVPSVRVLWEQCESQIEFQYVLFVDEAIISAPDAKLMGYRICLDTVGYYERLRKIFEKVETILNVPVIIAASNKLIYSDAKRYFDNRRLYYGKTLELIQHAELVLGHMSLALDQAIVSRKPVILLDDLSFTERKRKDFLGVQEKFKHSPVLYGQINEYLIKNRINQNLDYYHNIEQKYLRKDEVRDSYKNICINSFMKLLKD